jgi:hypothetical protein
MAIIYISPEGSNSNSGASPDPAAAGDTGPIATLAHAIGSGGIANPGDTIYLAPGVYRANTTATVSGSSGSPINVVGDPGNSRGFKDGSGNLLSAGEVRFTSYLADDISSPTTGSVLMLTGASWLNFSNIWFVGVQPTTAGTGSVHVNGSSHDVSFTACMFSNGMVVAASYALVAAVNTTSQLALNLTFDRCSFVGIGADVIRVGLVKTSGGSGDYSANVTFQNSLIMGGANQVVISSSGSGTYLGGDVNIKNCTCFDGRGTTVTVNDAGISSTTYPVKVYNSIIIRTNSPSLSANTSGQIVEDYNYIVGSRTNVTAGTNSTADGSKCLLLDFGQWMAWGQNPRPFMTPTPGSPQLGFGDAATAPAYDWLDRPRPEGGKSLSPTIGYVERHDTGVIDTAVYDSGSTASVRIDGPGSQEWQIPVDSGPLTISVRNKYDSTHGTALPPQLQVVDAPEIGITGVTPATAGGTANTWGTLSVSISPTAKGVVTVRGVAPSAASGSGKCWFDTFSFS